MFLSNKPLILIAIALLPAVAQSADSSSSERLSLARSLCEGADRSKLELKADVAAALQPGTESCRRIIAGEASTGPVQRWVESRPRKTLSFDSLMGSTGKPPEPTPPPTRIPARMTSRTPTRTPARVPAPTADPRKQLQLDFGNIDTQRATIKIHDTQNRIDGLGRQMADNCHCLDGGSCFDAPQFEYQSMNEAMADDLVQHDLQLRSMCNDWKEFAGQSLPEDVETLTSIETQLQSYLDAEAHMQATLRERTSDFHAEERRIARAEAAAQAQSQKKGNGFLAALTTMAAGAVLSDKLGFELDPDALAKTSVAVGRAVDSGKGMGAAFGEGVTGLTQMVRTATPIAPKSGGGGGDYLQDAMAHVKTYPAPSAANGTAPSGLSTMTVPGGLGSGAASTTFTGMTAPDLAGKFSDESIAEANRYMAAGHDLVLAQQTTPGGGQPDAFGVPEPTIEKISYVCRIPSSVPFSDGNGGKRYYYEHEVDLDVRYWIPECGEAKKAYYIANGCNRIDDMSAAEARCQQACGSPDCRSTKYEQQIMNGLAQ